MNSTVNNMTSPAESAMTLSSIRLALVTLAIVVFSLAAAGVIAAQARLLCGVHF